VSWPHFRTAARMALVEHARNRMAMLLVLFFIPTWLVINYMALAHRPIPFLLRAADTVISAPGYQVGQVAGMINSAALITGFMMFSVTFRSALFDRRLAMAGYPRVELGSAKSCVLVLVSALISGYSTALTLVFWRPTQPVVLVFSVFTATLTYGALGVLLACLVRGELEGMFLVIMISCIDVGLQDPAFIPNGSEFLRFFPTYGAVQSAYAAGFSTTTTTRHIGLQLLWYAALSTLGVLMFLRRTRDRATKGIAFTAPAEPVVDNRS
jgi:ABC-2 type transport system permease protein